LIVLVLRLGEGVAREAFLGVDGVGYRALAPLRHTSGGNDTVAGRV